MTDIDLDYLAEETEFLCEGAMYDDPGGAKDRCTTVIVKFLQGYQRAHGLNSNTLASVLRDVADRLHHKPMKSKQPQSAKKEVTEA